MRRTGPRPRRALVRRRLFLERVCQLHPRPAVTQGMADWFVYQRDVFPNGMDPDTLGAMLVPDYDTQGNVVYRDLGGGDAHGVRRVRTKWGICPRLVQYDLVVHACDPSTQALRVHTVQWWPRNEAFHFVDQSTGFRFENRTQGLCLCVSRDAQHRNHATLHRLTSSLETGPLGPVGPLGPPPSLTASTADPTYECGEAVGLVVGLRVHELVLFAPGSEGWFARYATASTRSSVEGCSGGIRGGTGPAQGTDTSVGSGPMLV